MRLLKGLFFLFFLSFTYLGTCQSPLGLRFELENSNRLKNNDLVSVFVKSNKKDISRALKSTQGFVRTQVNDIYTIAIPANRLNQFTNKLDRSAKIQSGGYYGRTLADTALINNRVDSAQAGFAPLIQAYTGQNVVVGIIDDGIYFNHEDFKHPDGSTRIRYIWDQHVNNGFNLPQPYNYGDEWNWTDINNGTCTHVEPSNKFSHGTNVAGIASGNGRATGDFIGVAPESEIIAVRIDYTTDFLAHLVDAVDYIFKKADAMGKACVINTSVGTYIGSHDGLDFATLAIEALLEERNGRAIVAAAGNGNNVNDVASNFNPTHLSYEVNNDTSFTWFRSNVQGNTITYFDLWADSSDFKNIRFGFGADLPGVWSDLGRSEFFSISDFTGDLQNGSLITRIIFDTAVNALGTLEMFAEELNGRYHLEFLITPNNINHYWRFMTTGSGTFDIWSSSVFQGSSNMVYDALPTSFQYPDIINYKAPDNKKCIVSSWQCSSKVITVGNYVNRSHYFDVDSFFRFVDDLTTPIDVTAGEIYYKSSEGPTRDNRIKPDVISTGNIVFASANINFITPALAVNRKKVAPGAWHTYNGGTSMSSPIVAGAVALYFEKNPNASWQEVKEAIITSTRKDQFTTPNTNNQYGYGKLNAFKMLQFNPIYGCQDSTAFNYNPNANVDDGNCEPILSGCTDSNSINYNSLANTDDGNCIPIVMGCTDSFALNYNAAANVDDGSCTYPTSILNNPIYQTKIYPNPAKEFILIETNQPLEIKIFGLKGRLVLSEQIKYNSQLDISVLTQGVYIMQITSASSNARRIIKLSITNE